MLNVCDLNLSCPSVYELTDLWFYCKKRFYFCVLNWRFFFSFLTEIVVN